MASNSKPVKYFVVKGMVAFTRQEALGLKQK